MQNDIKFALLIDAENISDRYIKTVLDELSSCGSATYKRIYGDWTSTKLSSWKQKLLDASILPVQQYSYTQGKNSTDSAMIIDAMDILYSGNVQGFCLVSSDSDFTRLAARLRESGMTVIGMGESKTPKPFIAACNQFKYLDILYAKNKAAAEDTEKEREETRDSEKKAQRPEEKAPQKQEEKPGQMKPKRVPETGKKSAPEQTDPRRAEPQTQPAEKKDSQNELPHPQTDLSTLREALISVVTDSSDEDGWMFTGDLGNHLAKRYPDFDVRNYGYSKLTALLESLGVFEIKRERASEYNNIQLVYVRKK